MGRYDKIRVYHNGQWKQPTYCRVYSGGQWKDLGDNTSYNTASMYVLKNGSYTRATLNRQDYSYVTDRWLEGEFNLLPAYGYNYCPKSSGGTAVSWYFRATIRKPDNGAYRLFYSGTGNTNGYIQLWWQNDGTIKVTACYRGTVKTLTSSNAVGANQDVYLNAYANAGSYTFYINFNGVTTSGTVGASYLYGGTTNTIGSAGLQFRGTVSVGGCNGSGNAYSSNFDASYASGTDGSNYANATHRESSSSGTNWV